jgi:elongation factor 1 alpha-like protein
VNVDAINLDIGSVLCAPDSLVPLATVFKARIIVFDIQLPITAGTSVSRWLHKRCSDCR